MFNAMDVIRYAKRILQHKKVTELASDGENKNHQTFLRNAAFYAECVTNLLAKVLTWNIVYV